MESSWLLPSLLALHGCLCLVCWYMMRKGMLRIGTPLMPVVVFIPVFGMLGVLGMHRMIAAGRDGTADTGEHLSDPAGAHITVEEEAPELVIPLEEAILINDEATRRSLMLSILHRDPSRFLDLLRMARLDKDVEITHYATTTIMEIQREYDVALLQARSEFEQQPASADTLDRYIAVLTEYADSNLLQGHLLQQQRKTLAGLLSLKLERAAPSRHTCFAIVKNAMQLGDRDTACKTSAFMMERWPGDERVWLSALDIAMDIGDAAQKATLMERIKSAPVHWTTEGQKAVRFLCGEDFFERADSRRGQKLSPVR